MKKSARVLEKLVSPGLPGLRVATPLVSCRVVSCCILSPNRIVSYCIVYRILFYFILSHLLDFKSRR